MGEKQGHTPGLLSANERDREAIPPAFTEHLGRQLLAHIQSSRQDQAA